MLTSLPFSQALLIKIHLTQSFCSDFLPYIIREKTFICCGVSQMAGYLSGAHLEKLSDTPADHTAGQLQLLKHFYSHCPWSRLALSSDSWLNLTVVKFMDLLFICLIASPPQQKLPAVPAAQATTRLFSVLSDAEWLRGVTEFPQHPKRMGIPLLPCIM